LIKSSFDASSTAMDVIAGIDLSGKTAVVTGGASGIGVETARALAQAGADVTLAVRNTEAGDKIAAEIIQSTGNKNVHVGKLDLADRSSIDAFVIAWGKKPLHILINNAGVMALQDRQLSPEGHELQFATNHLGHFHLSLGLYEALKAADGARLSIGQLPCPTALCSQL
jgi:NAD(P)-dependent dehydrogenase (short-subunit alcohol dehydrogenase family)